MITLPLKRLYKSLPLRISVPVVVATCLIGFGLYFFVLRSVSEFADSQIRESLATLSTGVYDLCDENFTELVQAGKIGNRKAEIIKKAVTLGIIEEYAQRNGLRCQVSDRQQGALLQYRIEPGLIAYIITDHAIGIDAAFQFQGRRYYFQHFQFKPWGWHVDLLKDTRAYAPLIARVKKAYIVTGGLLLLGLILILLLQERLLRQPLNRIINSMRAGGSIDYKGIYELEFLSDNISRMRRSLEEKNVWVEHLYRIAITNRGEDFFNRVVETLSEALDAHALIFRYHPAENRLHPVALSSPGPGSNAPEDLAKGLPGLEIVAAQESVIITARAHERFPLAQVLTQARAESYVGVPIFNRKEVVTGVMHVFGHRRAFTEWDLNLIKTVCQMVAVEFEYLAKERDKARLETQLQQSKKMEAIGLLAGGVAHDLNNVLSGVVSYPDLLLLDLPEDSPLKKPIITIQKSGQKAAQIVQDLLTLARRGVRDKQIFNLNAILTDYLQSPEYEELQARNPRVSVEINLDRHLLNIEGSATQIVNIVMNLVSNAAEAQPSGGKTTLSTHNRYVDHPLDGFEKIPEGEFAVLEIQDRGLGISSGDLLRIFEPFYSKKVMGKSGTGLGMAVVWGTIHDHDGFIDVESQEGVGTTFRLYFPVTRAKAVPHKGPIPVEEYMGHKETVLVIDDVPEQRDIATNILGKLNYTVTAVSSGESAVAYMASHSADIVVLDMIMEPGIDGLETYRRILKHHPGQRAIIASGYSETDRVKIAQELGVGKYIKKPYTLEKIGIAVHQELKK